MDPFHHLTHDPAVAELGRRIAEESVRDGTGVTEGRFVLGVVGGNVTAALGVMAVDRVGYDFAIFQADGTGLQIGGQPVGHTDPFFAGMEIGVSVMSHAAEQYFAAYVIQLTVAAFPVGGGVDFFLPGDVFLCPLAESCHGVGGMHGTVGFRVHGGKGGKQADAGVGGGQIHGGLGQIVQVGIGMGGNQEQSVFGEIVDEDIEKSFRPAFHFAYGFHGGMHQDGIGRGNAHPAELGMDVGFGEHSGTSFVR